MCSPVSYKLAVVKPASSPRDNDFIKDKMSKIEKRYRFK